jgi:hypothetical protein
MSATTYILDSALVLLVIIQMKERVLTNATLIRPFLILAVAVASYFSTFPTAGNDLPLILAISGIGAVLGVASGLTVIMRAGAASAILWVLGMGSRFAFAVWAASASGALNVLHFSAAHDITTQATWTVALLGMAVCEVLGRTLVMVYRRQTLQAADQQLALA